MSVELDFTAAALRGLAVGSFVGGVVYVMERAPPFIGGIVLVLPIVVGPSFFFLALQQDAAFMQAACITALGMIGAALCFLTAYIRLIGHVSAPLASLGGMVAWVIAALIIQALPVTLPWMLGFTLITAVLAWAANRRIVQLGSAGASQPSPAYDIALRGLFAGLLVAAVTLLASQLGPLGTSLLANLPVALSVVCLFLLRRFDSAGARAAMASSQIGLSSLVAFFLTLLLLQDMAVGPRFILACLATAAWAVLLGRLRRLL